MDESLSAALDYIPRWLEFQLRHTDQPGFGVADIDTGETLTPRHRFRVASHSKSFPAAAVMKLREQGRLKLDDPAGQYVDGLHPAVAEVTIAQLLSHSAGLVRDGADASHFSDRRPFPNERELRADLAEAPPIAPNTRFKYSNHGFGLVGLIIEAVTGEPYRVIVQREIVDPAGLGETQPDMPIADGAAIARPQRQAATRSAGRHSRRQPDQRVGLGRRLRQHRGRSGTI